MATVIGGALMSVFGASALGVTSTYGLMTAAVLGGGLSYMGTQNQGSINMPSPVNQVDKTTPQEATQLDSAKIDAEDSKKRKRKSAKSKFKIDETVTPSTTGVSLDTNPNAVTGVQI